MVSFFLSLSLSLFLSLFLSFSLSFSLSLSLSLFLSFSLSSYFSFPYRFLNHLLHLFVSHSFFFSTGEIRKSKMIFVPSSILSPMSHRHVQSFGLWRDSIYLKRRNYLDQGNRHGTPIRGFRHTSHRTSKQFSRTPSLKKKAQ